MLYEWKVPKIVSGIVGYAQVHLTSFVYYGVKKEKKTVKFVEESCET